MINKLKSSDYGNSVNLYVANEIEKLSTCLDVGCWDGTLGEFLIKEKQCVVDGIDFNEDELKKAKSKGYRNIFQLDLNEDITSLLKLEKNSYDYIIFADVLEHTLSPEILLTTFKPYLKKDGYMVISLPNVAFILNRLNLLFGYWKYADFGILDKTHLKFYTISSAVLMLKKLAFTIEKIVPYYRFGLSNIISILIKIFPTLFSYQFILKVKL